jgi:hypothetical protein
LNFDKFKVWCPANCLLQQGDLDCVGQGELIGILLIETELLTPMGNEVLVGSPSQTIINCNSIEVVKDLLGVVFGLSGLLGLVYHLLPHLHYGISITSV